MIRFPAELSAENFLADYWQKQPLFLPQAADRPAPSLSQNELGWLATLEDVESRIVFTDRNRTATRYRVETGPFDTEFLQQLPPRDWTLLVHDVEKHLPELRSFFDLVPFVPDWRIDDLMVSFAAPGGGVGPHKDHYDVFLVQGTGMREWRVSAAEVSDDQAASNDLALLQEFDGDKHDCAEGDILYLPPGIAHWGTATSACLTYSLGMRAPQLSDLVNELPDQEAANPFYGDRDLDIDEVRPGYISSRARKRADDLAGVALQPTTLGRYVSLTKDWLRPDRASEDDCNVVLAELARGGAFDVHGMARIAWDDGHVYVNGEHRDCQPEMCEFIGAICKNRRLAGPLDVTDQGLKLVRWLVRQGTFDLTAIS